MGIDTGLGSGRELRPVATTGRRTNTRTRPMPQPRHHRRLERETGIEPASLAWKAKVLPLNYSRWQARETASPRTTKFPGGGGWIRTSVGVSQQIYSLPPLATRAPLHGEPETVAQLCLSARRSIATVGRQGPRNASARPLSPEVPPVHTGGGGLEMARPGHELASKVVRRVTGTPDRRC